MPRPGSAQKQPLFADHRRPVVRIRRRLCAGGVCYHLRVAVGNVRVEDYELAQVKKAAGITDTVRIKSVSAPMPGWWCRCTISQGHQVNKGDPLVVMEAMKMENDIKSPLSGKIRAVKVSAGQSVEKGQVLVEFE